MLILGGFPRWLRGKESACQCRRREFKANAATMNMDIQISVLLYDVIHVLFNSFIPRQTCVVIRFLQLPLNLLNALEIHPSGYVFHSSLLLFLEIDELCSVV